MTIMTRSDVWTAETLRDDDCLPALRAEWNELYRRCATATPFQAHAWVESWWRTYGNPGQLRVVLVRRDGRLVAAVALLRSRRCGTTVLTPVGGAVSDFGDLLVDDEVAETATRLLVAELISQRDWQVVDFAETRPGSAIGHAVWPGRRSDLEASLCLELVAMPMEDLVRDLPSHTKKTVRRRINQIGRLDLDIREVPAADADQGIADLLRLHAAQWQGRAVNPEHVRPGFAEHLTRATRSMIEAGEAALYEYRIGGELVASSLVVIGPDLVGGYLYGADPGLRDQVDVTTLLLATTMPLAHRLGCSTMSMLRGAEAYKTRWRPAEVFNRRLLLARPRSPRAFVYTASVRAYRSAVRAAKQRAPWLREVRDRTLRLVRRTR
jgi:CelD/BcsL family acetyltransferase involved in cellulose biosynthesis